MAQWQGKEPLDELLNLMQVADGEVSADAGIAHYPPDALERIEARASLLRDAAMLRSNDLLQMAVEAMELGCGPQSVADLLLHGCHALGESQRWMELAANANFYRHHREMAERVAGVIRRVTHPDE